LSDNLNGDDNVAVGLGALNSNISGSDNTALGFNALQNSNSSLNTAIGSGALENVINGAENTAIGYQAGLNVSTGGGNILIGSSAGSAVVGAINVICLGNIAGENTNNRTYIANINGVTSSGGAAVYCNANGQLGTTTSSRRFKDNITDIDNSEKLYDLRPVRFTYKADEGQYPQYGLIAEEVEPVLPDLICYNQDGLPQTVFYQHLPAMMLKELQKQHTCIQEQKLVIDYQQKLIDKLCADVDSLKAVVYSRN